MTPARRKLLRLGLLALALAGAFLWLRHLPLLHLLALGARRAHGAGPLGVAAVGGTFFLATLLLCPILPLTIGCGWLYGLWGALVALLATVASAATAFSVSRALGRGRAAAALLRSPKAHAVAELAEEGGLATIVLLRLSSLLPFTPSNAVLGLTAVRLRDLVFGSGLGLLPGVFLYAWAGSLLPDADALERGESPRNLWVWALLAVGIAASALIGVAAARRLSKLRRATRQPA